MEKTPVMKGKTFRGKQPVFTRMFMWVFMNVHVGLHIRSREVVRIYVLNHQCCLHVQKDLVLLEKDKDLLKKRTYLFACLQDQERLTIECLKEVPTLFIPICFFDHVLMLLNCAHKRPIFTLFFFDCLLFLHPDTF